MLKHTDFKQKMLNTIRRYSMIEPGDKVLVAVSGGPDSVALLHALWSLRNDLKINLYVAHLNHSIRGADSDKDAEYVRQLAEKFGLQCTIETADVPEIRRTLRLSEEEAARLVRYDFLERTAEKQGTVRIAVAHTADDQVETVFLNFLRGTGLDGLSGMPPVRGLIVRPLIDVRRSEVESYVAANDLHPRTDLSNLDPTYTRNRVRTRLLPLLRHEFNPSVDSAILRFSELAGEDTAYLNTAAQSAFARMTEERVDGIVSLDAESLKDLPLALRRRVVRAAFERVSGSATDFGFVHVGDLLRMLDGGSDFEYNLPGRVFVQRIGSAITFSRGKPSKEPIIYDRELLVPGVTPIHEIEAAIQANLSNIPLEPVRPRDSAEAVLDFATVVGKLKVRNWLPGDRIRPLGLGGSKKVQDIFVDKKIPRLLRDRVPLIIDQDKVLWIAGLTVSDEAKITENTTNFLTLRVVPITQR